MSDYTLTTTDTDNILAAFSEGDDVIARRIFTVGGLCTEHGVTPKEVFESVNAHRDLTAGTDDSHRIVKGFSSSSVANAKTAYDLYLLTGVSPSKGRKSDRDMLAGLIEDVRRIHGAKTVKTTITDTVSVFQDNISADERFDGVVTVLRALKGIPNDKEDKTPQTPEERFLSALRAAVKLSTEIELSVEQADEAIALLAELESLNLSDAE